MLPSGANYPVDWVQMPHSVSGERSWRGTLEGLKLSGEGSTHTPRCGASTFVSVRPQGWSQPRPEIKSERPKWAGSFQSNNRCPLVVGERLCGKTKGSVRHGCKQNPSVCFRTTVKMIVSDFLIEREIWPLMATHLFKNWYLSRSCPLISIYE